MKRFSSLAPVALTFLAGVLGLVVPGPAGDVAAFVWLGIFPGLALTRLLLPGAPALTRWTLGVVLGPLAATLAAWAIVGAGQPLAMAARVVALGGWLLFAGGEARALAQPRAEDADAPPDRGALLLMLAAAAFVALPLLANPYLRVRSDTWVHAGLAFEVLERGFPPQDPRFAGLPLNYVWFYNLFVALLLALRPGSSPFTHMATANVVWIAAQAAVGWQLAWSLWRERAAARRGVLLLLTGLNAGTLLLWPLWMLRAAQGQVRGGAEVERIVSTAVWNRTDVLHQLCAPFAWMVNTWDKFTIGTSLGYAYVLALTALWAAVRVLGPGDEPRALPAWRWLGVVFAAAAGAMLFHSVVGLSLIPVGVGAGLLFALLAWRRPALGAATPALWLSAMLALALAATWPYFRSISAGWAAEQAGFRHSYLHADWRMPWTLLTACAVVAAAAWPACVRGWRESQRGLVWLGAFVLGMTAFAVVVHLPEWNEHKFVWLVFAPLALAGGPGASGLAAALQRRAGRALAALLMIVAFAAPAVLFQYGYLADRPTAAPELARAAGESELYAWVRAQTPVDAVFTDHRSRDVLLVEGRRRLLAGTPYAAERAAFPTAALARRRAAMAGLYGEDTLRPEHLAVLDAVGAPVYVLYRAADFAAGEPWRVLEADTTGFARVYDAGGFRVYLRRP